MRVIACCYFIDMKEIELTDRDRNIWVDYSKAIGIILVVYGHVARGIFNAGFRIDEGLYKLVDSIIYSFHMPLFFFLSGLFFFNSLTKRGIKGLLGSKIDSIIYPYLIWSIFQGVIEVYMSSHTNGYVNYSDVFSLLWQPRAQFWFLYALFMIFLVASILFNKVSEKFILPVFIGSILIYIFQQDIPSGLHINFISNNFVFFVFGMVLNKWADVDIMSSKIWLFATFISFVFIQYIFHSVLSFSYVNKGTLSLIVALISILFVVSLSKEMAKRPSNWFLFVGVSSMPIYLMHIIAASGSRIVLSNIFDVNSVIIHLLLGCVVGIGGSLIAVYLIKKYKLTFLLSLPISRLFQILKQKLI